MKFSFWNFVSGIYDWTFARSLNKDIPTILELGDFKPTDAVLDFGGGTGRVAEAIRDRVASVVVADRAEKMLEEAKAKGLTAELLFGLPTRWSDGSFDTILVIEAFHHLPHHEEHLKEFYRLLKPGGVLILEEPNTNSLIRYWLWTERLFDTVRYHKTDEWREFLPQYSFRVEKERSEGFMHFVRARK